MGKRGPKIKYQVSDAQIVKACEGYKSMMSASRALKIPFTSFIRRAKVLGCYRTNQAGKGMPGELWLKGRSGGQKQYSLADILKGKCPQISSSTLRRKVLRGSRNEEPLFENICQECGISSWKGKPLVCEVDHIDGNKRNHKLVNLRILCPNCHSQTDTHRHKKRV